MQPQQQPSAVFFTPDEVAAILKVNRRSVYDWLKAGKLQGYRVGDLWRISWAQIQAFLEQTPKHRPEPAAPDPGAAAPAPDRRAAPSFKAKSGSGRRR